MNGNKQSKSKNKSLRNSQNHTSLRAIKKIRGKNSKKIGDGDHESRFEARKRKFSSRKCATTLMLNL